MATGSTTAAMAPTFEAAEARRRAARAEAELLHRLPWLRPTVRPHRPVPPPSPPRPAPGSVQDIVRTLPWLAGSAGSTPSPASTVAVAGPPSLVASATSGVGGAAEGPPEGEGAEATAPGPALPEGLTPPGAITQRALPGLNAPKLFRYIDEATTPSDVSYGDVDTILADMVAVGARFFRQPTDVDLTVDNVTLPVVASGEELYAALFAASEQEDRLVSLFSRITPSADGLAPTYDLRVVLTLFTLGRNDSSFSDRTGEYDTSVVDSTLPPGVVGLGWDSGHGSSSVRFWDGAAWTLDQYVSAQDLATPGTYTAHPADQSWVYGTLDMRSPYKLMYLYHMGYALGLMLLEVNRQLVEVLSSAPIWSRILGIEVCNEVNKTNPLYNYDDGTHGNLGALGTTYEASATLWAWGVCELVRGFQHALSDAVAAGAAGATGLPERLPLWLPSMATYYADGYTTAATSGQPNVVNILDFHAALCEKLIEVFDPTNDATRCPEAPFQPDLSWFVNQDYHFYHYREDQAAGPILRLIGELSSMRENFRASSFFDAVGHNVTLSVCEIGAAADDANIDKDVGAFEYMDATRFPTTTTPDRFQAREVWRRLAVAAIRARYFAWHTHMSVLADAGDATGYHYLGLREDALSPPSRDVFGNLVVVPASEVDTRMSWWAYQRLVNMAVTDGPYRAPEDVGAIAARLINPRFRPPPSDVSAHAYFHTLSQSDPELMLLVVHFQIAEDDHAYLIMLDATTSPAAVSAVSATLATESGESVEYYQWSTVPASVAQASAGASESDFPVDTADTGWDTGVSLGSGSSIELPGLVIDQDPVLIRTTQRLQVIWP